MCPNSNVSCKGDTISIIQRIINYSEQLSANPSSLPHDGTKSNLKVSE